MLKDSSGLKKRPTLQGLDPELLLDQSSLAEILLTSEKFLERRRCTGGGPSYIKVGSLCRYRVRDVAEWLEEQRVRSTSEVVK